MINVEFKIVLKYHNKKNNYESIAVVEDSIELVKSFKLELLSYEFWLVNTNLDYEKP